MKKYLIVLAALVLSSVVQAQEFGPFSKNGFNLSGAEYWPYKADGSIDYPGDILWDFDHPQATPEVKACARTAFAKLSSFLDNPPATLVAFKAKGYTPNFYLWTNDYSKSNPGVSERANKFWHWNSGSKDYSKGFWKWESTLTQAGVCLIPEDAQIAEQLETILKATSGN